LVPAVGVALALSAALCAGCFVRAYGVAFLGRARSIAAKDARETDPWSLSAMSGLLALCLLAGLFPSYMIDTITPAAKLFVGGHVPTQGDIPWMSIVPIAESRSSYNGLLVFVFIIFSASVAALIVRRFGSKAIRRGPAWDCGYPDPSPATQYTGSSFAQPIRRTLGNVAFVARDHLDMPPPGDTRPARFGIEVHDRVWDGIYTPILRGVEFCADQLNRMNYLTIQEYLGLVFIALVGLLLVIAIWP
jgi:hypothetical protein